MKTKPPARIPAPAILLECAKWNWVAMTAPEENPETVMEYGSTLYFSEIWKCLL